MKAVVVHGANDLRIDDRPEPVAGPRGGSARRRMGRDLRLGPFVLAPRRLGDGGAEVAARPRPRGGRPDRPAGRRRARTSTSASRSPSTRPNSWGTASCRTAWRAAPTSTRRSGTSARQPLIPHTDGGFSERKLAKASQIRPLPDGVDTLHGALAEPLAVAMHAVSRAGIARRPGRPGQRRRTHRLAGGRSGQVRRCQDRHRRRHQRRSAADRQSHGRGRSP